MCSSCTFLELLTPVAPKRFLALASLSAAGKAIGVSTALAVQPAIHKNFAMTDNISEITAKSQAQHVVVDNVGMIIAIAVTKLAATHLPGRQALLAPLFLFFPLAVGDVFCTYKELKSVHLRSLNRTRAEMVITQWVEGGLMPTPLQASATENLLFPEIIGPGPRLQFVPLSRLPITPSEAALLGGGRARWTAKLLDGAWPATNFGIALRNDATPRDILTAILHATYVRMEVTQLKTADMTDTYRRREIIEHCLQKAQLHKGSLLAALSSNGWDVSQFLLGSSERCRWRVDDSLA
ncbi:unnamed protein product [Pedinophyceae sp. YPF-701]|nr:unnamed protein product [Pedinophyceae sp. YPF-701]